MKNADPTLSLPDPARFGLPELDPEGRPWSPLTLLILRQRSGEISLEDMMRGAMPFVRRVARYAGNARRLSEEAEEIAQELAILLYTDLYRAFDPARADAMSMLTTYARSVARTEERRADRRPTAMEPDDPRMPQGRSPSDFVTGMAGTGAAREGDDDPYFARLDQTLAQRRLAAALSPADAQPAARLVGHSKGSDRTARDGAGRGAVSMSARRKSSVTGVIAELPEVPVSLGSIEVVERRGVPGLASRKMPGERRSADLTRSQSKKSVTREQQLLRETRRRLGYTAPEFATLLGIGAPRLASYEYGVTSSVPPEIMERLERISRKQAAKADTLATFKDKLIGTIVSDWEQQLRPYVYALMPGPVRPSAGEPLTPRLLSLEIGVNHVTLKRWWRNMTRPPETRIAAVDEKVRQRLSAHKARALEIRLANRKPS